jgi:hypothetical protein
MRPRPKQIELSEPDEPLDLMAHDVRRIAVDWSWKHLPDRLSPANPEWHARRKLWRVPIILSYPGICLGEVGEVWVDADSGVVAAHTEVAEIEAQVLQLGRKNRAKIRAAFLRTRVA